MPGHDIIVVGASAGGVEALKTLARDLPADLPAAVFIVLHVPAHGTSVLPAILNRVGPLPAQHATHEMPIQPGHIYIAPPDHHLLLHHGHLALSRGPRENGHRPAVDVLFRSAARAHGSRVIGAILSGVLDDGTAGLQAVKMRGGLAIAQDPDDALYSGMPRSAVENVKLDHIVPIDAMAALLARLAVQPAPEPNSPAPREMRQEVDLAELDMDALSNPDHPGTPSAFGCPDCGGVLWEINEGELTRFRCRVGHAWSADSLVAKQSEELEEALWVALRALEERASLSRRLAHNAHQRGHELASRSFEEQCDDALRKASIVRNVLSSGAVNSPASHARPTETAHELRGTLQDE